ncbi:MAG: aldehyde dehydrogenase (NADP(+)) [Thalassotalea sp.]
MFTGKNKLTGQQLIAGTWQLGNGGSFQAVNPKINSAVAPGFTFADATQISAAVSAADAAFLPFSETSLAERSKFLRCCAQEIADLGDELIDRAMLETGYDRARVLSEQQRVCAQFELYAEVVLAGDYLNIRINTAMPSRKPSPRSDLRFINQALGPVVVFGASNFPLAYSVAGGDTVSALAAGCPVIVKGHNSHPGTCELVAIALTRAVEKTKLPAGTFSMLLGEGNAIGEQLVAAPKIKAVAFTGSTQGGLSLLGIANKREEPIPVFAEMGSINPVILLPKVLQQSAKAIANNYIASLTDGTGQFCVSPGLIIAIADQGLAQFEQTLIAQLAAQPAGVMLNKGIFNSYQQSALKREKSANCQLLASGRAPSDQQTGFYTPSLIYKTNTQTFIEDKSLHEEMFGHAALIVTCQSVDEMAQVINALSGQLACAVHGLEDELVTNKTLLTQLKQKVGRIVINGFTTGVEVCEAMMHGGPFPASTDVRFTSVGTAAIARFVRPICYQNSPEVLLPEALKNDNPLNLKRNVNGIITNQSLTYG